MAANPLPYPNHLQCRSTTNEYKNVALAAVDVYRAALAERAEGLTDNTLLTDDERTSLQRQLSQRAEAETLSLLRRERAREVIAQATPPEEINTAGGVDHDLFRAACDGDVAAIQRCLCWASPTMPILTTEARQRRINALGQPHPDGYGGIQFEKRHLFRAPPLSLAAAFGREDAVKVLLENGADPFVSATTGLRARDYAEARGYTEIVKLLLDAESAYRKP